MKAKSNVSKVERMLKEGRQGKEDKGRVIFIFLCQQLKFVINSEIFFIVQEWGRGSCTVYKNILIYRNSFQISSTAY